MFNRSLCKTITRDRAGSLELEFVSGLSQAVKVEMLEQKAILERGAIRRCKTPPVRPRCERPTAPWILSVQAEPTYAFVD